MKNIRSSFTVRLLVAVVAFALVLAEPQTLSAQKRKPFPTPPSEPATSDSTSSSSPNFRSSNQAALEIGILMSRRASVADLERQRRRAAARLAEDLEKLGQINSVKIVPLTSTTALDYKDLALAAAEINTRATRIKFYSPLALVDRTGEKIRCEADESHLATMLPQLTRAVTRLVGNPVFRISSPNDAELRSAAAHDLESIIKLSKTISKLAKRLSKPVAEK